jgi:hypothetical protein
VGVEAVNSLVRQCGEVDIIADNAATFSSTPHLLTFSPLNPHFGGAWLRRNLPSG